MKTQNNRDSLVAHAVNMRLVMQQQMCTRHALYVEQIKAHQVFQDQQQVSPVRTVTCDSQASCTGLQLYALAWSYTLCILFIIYCQSQALHLSDHFIECRIRFSIAHSGTCSFATGSFGGQNTACANSSQTTCGDKMLHSALGQRPSWNFTI